MNRIAIIFGGAGYIGSFLTQKIIQEERFDNVYIYDLKTQPFLKSLSLKLNVKYILGDVRMPIDINFENEIDLENSWIFNFAAIHREPGHLFQEYFDTNIPGAENINLFANQIGIKNLFFTSSIAPYGKSINQRTENSSLYPETAYGISKSLAEQIHQNWLSEDYSRRLIIVRPSVIFGPKDPGNVYRMIKGLKKGNFILPNGGEIIKGYGYVYGLVESILFTMNKMDRLIIYNYAENPLVTLKEMVEITKEELGIKKPTIKLSIKTLSMIAWLIQKVFKIIGKQSDIHPVRVRKAGFPTNIKPNYLIKNGFDFKYEYRNAIRHWQSVTPEDFI